MREDSQLQPFSNERSEAPKMLSHLALVLGLSSLGICTIHASINEIPNLDWDFIIVGGGTAGSVLAGRLTENPKFNVLVIEAGPTNEGVLESIIPGLQAKNAGSRFDWNFTTTPQKGFNGRSVAFQRGHILGGSSSVNGMVYTRGSSSDFDRFARVSGDPGWSWDALQPYIRKHEKLEKPADNHDTRGQFDPAVHSTTGTVPVTLPGFSRTPAIDAATLQASKELGGDFQFNLDMNSGTPLGLGWLQSTIGHDGTRSSAATSYLGPRAQSRKNLHVVTDTRVTRVLKTESGNTKGLAIRTIEVRSLGSQQTVRLTASKEVILAAGTISTPHILLNSGIGDQDELKALNISTVLHNPSVGRNFSDHSLVIVPFQLDPNSVDLGPWVNVDTDPAIQAKALELWKTNRTGPYTMFLPTPSSIVFTRLPSDSPIFERFPDPSSGSNSAHIELFLTSGSSAYAVIFALVSPASRGAITLRSNNPFDDPLIDPGYYTSEFDLFATREGIRSALRFAKAPVWNGIITGVTGPLANATTDAELDEVIRNTSLADLHPVATASMSPRGASWGVVDPDLLVKKASGLRIVDASVMPYVPCAHTQSAVYYIAERASDLIKAAWA